MKQMKTSRQLRLDKNSFIFNVNCFTKNILFVGQYNTKCYDTITDVI